MRMLGLFILFLSSHAFANQLHEQLYLSKTQNSLCLYTNNPNSKLRDDNIALINLSIPGSNARSVSEDVVDNLKTPPRYESDCLLFSLKDVTESGPYSLVLDMDKTYAANFCLVVDDKKNTSIHKLGSQLQCQQSEYKNPFSISLEIKKILYKIKSFFSSLIK
ncbi:hypothetical protein DZC41_01970 [Acinetobacter haemolyticus]|uniref:NF045616 family extracytoplasmic (lipo)protein n=1 Tax=Acinetobacter haemolyticus TaxID=29430 RepID=UPI000AD9D170|nr:NF045616 family extracytoplasmic (lipo)protein [Acinetobacter haemolyticus]NAR36432.1 hypothetical protein [Acinetobacter haemolyticus]NCU22272.1 hypothetical protein [Acinetobacter haemolyticus]